MSQLTELLAKYDIPAPRYTSYPTVPYWEVNPTRVQWIHHLRETLIHSQSGYSIYIHVPYCETLCTFCGCNNIITKDHKKEDPYVDHVVHEWNLYLKNVPELQKRPLKLIHLGGGSPTFLLPESLTKMLKPILDQVPHTTEDFEASVEVDPRRTTVEHLKALRELGFNRISLGVQDFDPEVQRLVNRHQPYEITAGITRAARDLGYNSVNFDLIYGLAKQTPESIKKSAELTVELRPDRIALYSFAKVPWIKPQQRLFKDDDLPEGAAKRELYEIARNVLMSAGYVEVGMDHFALPNDQLAVALKNKSLHRNFMGYTDQKTDVLLGLGVSSISETPYSFHQNQKVLPLYEEDLKRELLPTLRGHVLDEEDSKRRKQILQLMTQKEVQWENSEQREAAREFLHEMIQDQLIEIHDDKLSVTDLGKPFIRNACLFFDERLRRKQPTTETFSKSI